MVPSSGTGSGTDVMQPANNKAETVIPHDPRIDRTPVRLQARPPLLCLPGRGPGPQRTPNLGVLSNPESTMHDPSVILVRFVTARVDGVVLSVILLLTLPAGAQPSEGTIGLALGL